MTTTNSYVALIRKARDSDYSVDFPDVPGCVTAGKDLDEALAFAREALAGHLQLLAEDGEALPEASNLEAVMADPENRDAVAALVPAPMVRGKAVRVNVMLDEYLLKAIDKLAGTRGRSEFLAEAARARVSGARRHVQADKPVGSKSSAKSRQWIENPMLAGIISHGKPGRPRSKGSPAKPAGNRAAKPKTS
jgi:predicted RNase H-like HicB family nuclease